MKVWCTGLLLHMVHRRGTPRARALGSWPQETAIAAALGQWCEANGTGGGGRRCVWTDDSSHAKPSGGCGGKEKGTTGGLCTAFQHAGVTPRASASGDGGFC